MFDPTKPSAEAQLAARRMGAAEKVLQAKVLEHEAAMMANAGVERAAQSVMDAQQAFLDAREAFYRLVYPRL